VPNDYNQLSIKPYVGDQLSTFQNNSTSTAFTGAGTTTFEGTALSNQYIYTMYNTAPECSAFVTGELPLTITSGNSAYFYNFMNNNNLVMNNMNMGSMGSSNVGVTYNSVSSTFN
jgi:hypothetical protein